MTGQALHPCAGRCGRHIASNIRYCATCARQPTRPDDTRRHTRQKAHGRTTAHWQRIRAEVLRRDHQTCRICGQPGTTVHLDPSLHGNHHAATADDGVTLCHRCHGQIDGPRANTAAPPRPGLELTVLCAPVAAGKTTLAAQLAQRPNTTVISVDEIRHRHGLPDGERRHAFAIAYHETTAHLAAGTSVVFDSTAVTERVRRSLLRIARRTGARSRLIIVITDPALRAKRNAARERPVPVPVRDAITDAWMTTLGRVHYEGWDVIDTHREEAA